MATTGEKPGRGTYKCKVCGITIKIDNIKDTLPSCPKCNNATFDRIA